MLPVGSWHLAAQPWSGEDLPRVAEALWIEGRSDELHDVQVVGREHLGHGLWFVCPNTVLTGNRPSGFDAVGQDFGADGSGLFRLAGHAFVVADERMEVAVARVKDIGDPQAGPGFELPDPVQDLG